MTECENRTKGSSTRPKTYFVWGWGGTIIWLAFVAWYFNFDFTKILCLEPNLFGDFMAGTFAPLAFLWLVVGLLQQGQELHLQYEELTKTVEHSSKQAAAQQGHEKHMRQSVLNETRQIFERDLASIAVEAIGRRQIPNKVAAALGAADYNNVCSKIASFLSHDNHTGYIDLNRKENSFDEDYYEEQAQLAKFSEERYLDCYQHGLKCLVALEGSEYYEKYYKNSPFYSLYELFCMDIEANDKLTNPQDSEPS